MANTIVGLYDDRTTAVRVLQELKQAGFGKDHLRLSSNETDPSSEFNVDVKENATPDALARYGVPEDEADFYAESVRRGGALVVARVRDEDAEAVSDVMARHAPVNYEKRSAEYRQSGFAGYDRSAPPYDTNKMQEERGRYASERGQRLQEIEESLKVGKREVIRGAVRVHKYVETERAEETIRLREQHAEVERTTVDRALSPEEADAAFREETIEVVERAEEAVVSKEARVVGEVQVGTGTTEREETVGADLRRTRVEVEEVEGGRGTSGGYADYDRDFRSHFQTAYGNTGRDYSEYEPAYRYGAESRGRYAGRNYADVERDLRSDYEGRYGQGAWENVKDAVRTGWERVKDTARDATR